MAQFKSEPIAEFIQRLRIAATDCEFGDATAINAQISLQVIQGCKNQTVRKKALQESLDLAAIIKFAQGLEISEAHSKFVENSVHLDGSASSSRFKQEALSISNSNSNSNRSGQPNHKQSYQSNNIKVVTAQAH